MILGSQSCRSGVSHGCAFSAFHIARLSILLWCRYCITESPFCAWPRYQFLCNLPAVSVSSESIIFKLNVLTRALHPIHEYCLFIVHKSYQPFQPITASHRTLMVWLSRGQRKLHWCRKQCSQTASVTLIVVFLVQRTKCNTCEWISLECFWWEVVVINVCLVLGAKCGSSQSIIARFLRSLCCRFMGIHCHIVNPP